MVKYLKTYEDQHRVKPPRVTHAVSTEKIRAIRLDSPDFLVYTGDSRYVPSAKFQVGPAYCTIVRLFSAAKASIRLTASGLNRISGSSATISSTY